MAMNAAALAAAMTIDVLALIESDFLNIADDHTLTGFTTEIFWTKICTAISNNVVSHIQANARCLGLDSGLDSHNNVGII